MLSTSTQPYYHVLLSNSPPLLFSFHTLYTPTCSTLLKYDSTKSIPKIMHMYTTQLQSSRGIGVVSVCVVCVCVCCVCVVCVCVCVCVCVLWRGAASISSLANWYMVLCIYIYIANVHIKIVWVCCMHPAQLQALRIIDFMVSGLSLLCCSHFRKAACLHLSDQLRTSTSAGRLWLRSGVRPLPNSTITPR